MIKIGRLLKLVFYHLIASRYDVAEGIRKYVDEIISGKIYTIFNSILWQDNKNFGQMEELA